MTTPDLVFRGRRLTGDRALVMAIVNRTPDSFYDNGVTFDETLAQKAISRAIADGADLIDVGGIPASPGPEVSVEEEIRRVLPTVEWARATYPDLVISIDTYRHEVADVLCRAGADLINDNWAAYDPQILEVAAQYGTGYVCSHTDGLEPRTDPIRPQYEDVVASVIADTTVLAERAVAKGVPREGIMIDPCIDFSKNTYHSLAVLRHVDKLVATGWPVLMALSNKGAQGLMQLMPETAGDLGVNDAFDVAQNISGGAKYLAQLLKDFNGNMQLATAAYNAGEGAVQKYGGVPPYDETQVYVQRVQQLRDRYKKAL